MDIKILQKHWMPDWFLWMKPVQIRTELLPGELSSALLRPDNYERRWCLQKSDSDFELLTEDESYDLIKAMNLKYIIREDSFMKYGVTLRRL